ncbi:MAG: tetratricopeptide repeat protein [Verrucomicrobiota bacterium]
MNPPAGQPLPPRAWLAALALAALTVVVFWPVRQHDFISYDDPKYITENPLVLGGLTWDGIGRAFVEPHFHMWHPLTTLSHMLDVELFGVNAGPHHLVSASIHALNGALLFLVLLRMTGLFWPSLVVAALFAWHPLRVESVAWASERKDVLSTLFWLLTIGAYVRYVSQPGLRRYALLLAAFALGITTKPMIVTLPCALLLLDYWPLKRFTWPARKETLLPLLREKTPLFALSALLAVITYLSQRGGDVVVASDVLPVMDRLANAVVAYARYLGKLAWPTDLAVFYPRENWALWQVGGAVALLACTTVVAVRGAARRPYGLTGWLWFVGILVPVIGLVQAGGQSLADRYTYVPTLGIILAGVWIARDLGASLPRAIKFTLAAIALAACIAGTRAQLHHWRNSETLFTHALAINPNNPLAHNHLGDLAARGNDLTNAIAHYEASLRIAPGHANTLNSLGVALETAGRTGDAERRYRAAIGRQPDFAEPLNNLATLLVAQGKTPEAMPLYLRALELRPDYAEAHFNFGVAFERSGDLSRAAAAYSEAVRARPTYAKALNNLGAVLQQLNQPQEALRHYEAAVSVAPDFFEARSNLARLLERLGRIDAAIVHYQELMRRKAASPQMLYRLGALLASRNRPQAALDALREATRARPDWPEVLALQARLLATTTDTNVRNGAEAVRLAERADELSGGMSAIILDTLAAAYAEAGRFAEAQSTARRAQDVAQRSGQVALAQEISARLKGYEQNRPYREGAK